LQITDQKK